jgi:hypothetical protein
VPLLLRRRHPLVYHFHRLRMDVERCWTQFEEE